MRLHAEPTPKPSPGKFMLPNAPKTVLLSFSRQLGSPDNGLYSSHYQDELLHITKLIGTRTNSKRITL